MLFTKPLIKKYSLNKTSKTNLDRIIGMRGIVTETIKQGEVGEVKVDGKKWSAYSDLPEPININTFVKIEAINSVKLKVTLWKE